MSQENKADPWEEVEGIPPLVERLYRTPPEEERSWLTTLSEVRGLVWWLSEAMSRLSQSTDVGDENIGRMTMGLDPLDAINLHSYIQEKMLKYYEECSAVYMLVGRLLNKANREIIDELRASHSASDR